MASKTYTVIKDGETVKELKNLAAAKKLADMENAEVFCEGLCVYAPDPAVSGDDEASIDDPEPVVRPELTKPQKYTLTAKMNIRKAPSLDARKLGIAEKGKIVEVLSIDNDWLHLTDNTFILYEGGRFATKN